MSKNSPSSDSGLSLKPSPYLCVVIGVVFIFVSACIIVYQRQIIHNLSGNNIVLTAERDELQRKNDGVFKSSAYALLTENSNPDLCMPVPAPGRKVVYHKVSQVVSRQVGDKTIYIIGSKNLESGIVEITVSQSPLPQGKIIETTMSDNGPKLRLLPKDEAQIALEKFGRVGQN